jgi:hypothetical protein
VATRLMKVSGDITFAAGADITSARFASADRCVSVRGCVGLAAGPVWADPGRTDAGV